MKTKISIELEDEDYDVLSDIFYDIVGGVPPRVETDRLWALTSEQTKLEAVAYGINDTCVREAIWEEWRKMIKEIDL